MNCLGRFSDLFRRIKRTQYGYDNTCTNWITAIDKISKWISSYQLQLSSGHKLHQCPEAFHFVSLLLKLHSPHIEIVVATCKLPLLNDWECDRLHCNHLNDSLINIPFSDSLKRRDWRTLLFMSKQVKIKLKSESLLFISIGMLTKGCVTVYHIVVK